MSLKMERQKERMGWHLGLKAKRSYMIFAMKYTLVVNGEMTFMDSVIIPNRDKAWS